MTRRKPVTKEECEQYLRTAPRPSIGDLARRLNKKQERVLALMLSLGVNPSLLEKIVPGQGAVATVKSSPNSEEPVPELDQSRYLVVPRPPFRVDEIARWYEIWEIYLEVKENNEQPTVERALNWLLKDWHRTQKMLDLHAEKVFDMKHKLRQVLNSVSATITQDDVTIPGESWIREEDLQ